MRTGFVGEALAFDWPVLDDFGDPVTGIVNGAWTKTVRANGATSAQTLTVTEIGATGRYTFSFTPDVAGRWYIEAYDPTTEARIVDEVEVGLFAEGNVALVDTGTTVRVLSWLTRNGRQVTTATNSVVTIYDDAGAQVAQVTDGTADARGFFFGTAALVVADNRTFSVTVAITDPLGVVTTTHGSVSVASA